MSTPASPSSRPSLRNRLVPNSKLAGHRPLSETPILSSDSFLEERVSVGLSTNPKPGEDPAQAFELVEKIGSGSFGVVYKGSVHSCSFYGLPSFPDNSSIKSIHRSTGLQVAIKQIDLEDSVRPALLLLRHSLLFLSYQDDDISEIQQEISHLAQCNSEWITKYYGS
jgi:serine/threonine-protein kinase 24/25/MST4